MATQIAIDHVTFYAHFASALINGDYSGLTVEDTEELEKFWDYVGDGQPVSIEDVEYFGHPDVPNTKPGTVVDYVIHYAGGDR